MGPARRNTTRFLFGFVTVLVLVPALVWGIRAVEQDPSTPASASRPAADQPREDELGCTVLTAPESLAERAAACETEPAPVSPAEPQRRKPRDEQRRGRTDKPSKAEPEDCDTACEVGAIEAEILGDAAEPVEPAEEPQDVTELVGSLLAPARELPTDPLVEDVEEALEAIETPDGTTEKAARVIEDAEALLPDALEDAPAIEIQLGPAPVEPIPAPVPVPPVDPTAELPHAPSDAERADPDPSVPTAVLVLDENTAEELGISRRMTIGLSRAAQRALAILSERAGLELSVAEPGTAEPPRD